MSNLPNNEELYNWWIINGRPNREMVRNWEDDKLPASKGLIESLLPIFSLKFKEPINMPSEDQDAKSDNKRIVITSDWHIPFHDVDCLNLFFKFLQDYQPDELVLNGNINDCTSFSSHPRIRDLANAFRDGKEERDFWFYIARGLRSILPNTKIVYIGSQCHEGWINQWVQASPILVEDENYTIKGWFKLDDFGIEFVDEVYKPLGTNSLLVTHGTIARGKCGASAMGSLEMEGTSVIVGHTHRLSQVYKTNSTGEYVGIEGGCLCNRTPWYHLKGRRTMMDWQQGFVLLNIERSSFSTQVVPIIRDSEDNPFFFIGGTKWK